MTARGTSLYSITFTLRMLIQKGPVLIVMLPRLLFALGSLGRV